MMNPPKTRVPPRTRHYNLRFRCERCHIRIPVEHGKCDDCATNAPLITYADSMGAERFYQIQRPRVNVFADSPVDVERSAQIRAWRKTPAGQAHSRRPHRRAGKG